MKQSKQGVKISWERFENKEFPGAPDNPFLEGIWYEILEIDSTIAGCMHTFLKKGYFWVRYGVKRRQIFYACYKDLKNILNKLRKFRPIDKNERDDYESLKKYLEIAISSASVFAEEDKKKGRK